MSRKSRQDHVGWAHIQISSQVVTSSPVSVWSGSQSGARGDFPTSAGVQMTNHRWDVSLPLRPESPPVQPPSGRKMCIFGGEKAAQALAGISFYREHVFNLVTDSTFGPQALARGWDM